MPALPVTPIDHVPEAPVPVTLGAPIVLYEIVCATEPLKVIGDAPPAPPLLNVALLVTETPTEPNPNN